MKLLRLIKAACCIALDLAALAYARLSKLPRDTWLISERGYDARDNGYCFFRYLRRNHPDIRAVYVITRDSPDLDRIRALGGWTRFGSFAHRALMMSARVLISTHDCGYTPDMVVYHHLKKRGLFRPRGRTVLLQHGVLHRPIQWYSRGECAPDVFVVSTEDEFRLVTEQLGQPESAVRLTGLPRFDTLDGDKAEKLVLVMPTWRKYLARLAPDAFAQSDYSRAFASLLGDERLVRLLDENGYRLVFYPHAEMQKFYAPETRGSVRVASMATDDVQGLLNRCQILVTDYSSVFYDAAYMGKPVVFYQFDRARADAGHYPLGRVDYPAFGEVCLTEDEVVNALARAAALPSARESGRKGPFRYRDTHNCDRVFQAILETLG
ncbi:MAG: CDP-glycerol glycerophosphotransferase family protein [Clostridia bacterium]|nr:CDP-glycerol glycerophosphotransferase family protein [Clostridia bacterium]